MWESRIFKGRTEKDQEALYFGMTLSGISGGDMDWLGMIDLRHYSLPYHHEKSGAALYHILGCTTVTTEEFVHIVGEDEDIPKAKSWLEKFTDVSLEEVTEKQLREDL